MQIQARYTEAIVKRATMRFWIRYTGWRGIAALLVLAAIFTCLLVNGDSSWYVPVLGTVFAFGVVIGCTSYVVTCRRALATLRRMAEPIATIDFSDAGISTQSDLGRCDLAWRGITQVWTFPEAWLVFVAKGSYFTIPTESLTEEIQQFIRQKMREHSGKVV
jgi:hypothetical protein